MKIQHAAPLLIVIVGLATSALLARSAYNSSRSVIALGERNELQTVASVMQNAVQMEVNKSAQLAGLIATLPTVRSMLRAKDATRLVKELKPSFLKQRQQFNLEEGQFFMPPAMEFLRMLNPASANPDVSDFRQMVLTVSRNHKDQRGLEMGRHGLGIHGVAMLQDAKGPIGTFDIGLFFKEVLDHAKLVTGSEAGLFIEDRLVTRYATLAPKTDPEHMVGTYRNMEATDWTTLRPLISADLLTHAQDVTFDRQKVNGIPYGIVVVPLLDFKGAPIGYLAAARSFEAYQAQSRAALINAIALSGFQALLLIGAVLLAFNGMLMRPLAGLRESLARLERGQAAGNLDGLLKRQDELGAMARSLDAVGKRLAAKAPEA